MYLTRIKLDSFKKSQQANFVAFIECIENGGRMLAPWLIQLSIDNDLNPIMLSALIMMVMGTLPVIVLQRVAQERQEEDEMNVKGVNYL
jgi:predicted metal-binding protein